MCNLSEIFNFLIVPFSLEEEKVPFPASPPAGGIKLGRFQVNFIFASKCKVSFLGNSGEKSVESLIFLCCFFVFIYKITIFQIRFYV